MKFIDRINLFASKIIMAIIVQCIISGFTYAQVFYYVSPNGDDNYPGTEEQPWKTIRKAFNSAIPGSTVFIKTGVYFEKDTVNVSGNEVDGFITFCPYGNDTVIIDGTGKIGSQIILIENKNYIRIIGLELRNNLNQTFGSGIWVRGKGKHIEIRKNRIHNMRARSGGDAMAISIYGTSTTPLSHIIIDGNIIYQCQPGRSEALTLNGNIDTFRITNNVVYDVNNIGIDMIGGEGTCNDPSQDAARNGLCSGNIVYNAHSGYEGGYAAGIYVDGGMNIIIERNSSFSNDVGIEIGCENIGRVASNIIVRNNLVYANDKRGIGIGGYNYPVTGKVINSKIFNNTCYNNDVLGVNEGELVIEYTENCTIKNNIFFTSTQNRLMVSTVGNNSGNILDYNLWYAPIGEATSTVDYNGVVYTGFNNYKLGTNQDVNSIFSHPKFLLASLPNPNLHLRSISPAIDAGDPNFNPSYGETDFDGFPRVFNNRIDIGAYEYTLISPPAPLLLVPKDSAELLTPVITLYWSKIDSGATYHCQIALDTLFSSIAFEDSTLADTIYEAGPLYAGVWYYWRVRTKVNNLISAWSEIRKFIYIDHSRWKLISVHLRTSEHRKNILFPTSISNAYSYQPDAGYLAQDSLFTKLGYWLKFGMLETANVNGDSIFLDTISVIKGWNLIGSISVPINMGSIITIPSNLLISPFWSYIKSGYTPADTILPGNGYWVKVNEDGLIIYNAVSETAGKNINNIPNFDHHKMNSMVK